jgi:hypothetical protein
MVVAHPVRLLMTALFADEYFSIQFKERPVMVNPFE